MTAHAEQPSPPPRALLIEDDESVRRSLQLLLHWRGYDVRSYPTATSLLNSDQMLDAQILVADYCLPDGTGIDVLRELRNRGWAGRSVLITAFPSAEVVRKAHECGYDRVLEKPLRQQALIAAIAA